eukprot:TRINITY_DN10990_c0_g3_i2.p1 TRINITY_DN10990_c0_g3~~TRINITY_DN10990_c0_g3_i2.p1  ORF type:complete len:659 (+),score=128.20 TRINITY_DN10990_c0_g3_i2:52-1977(+)
MNASNDLSSGYDESSSVESFALEEAESLNQIINEIPVGFMIYRTDNPDDLNGWILKTANSQVAKVRGIDMAGVQKLFGKRMVDDYPVTQELHEQFRTALVDSTTVDLGVIPFGPKSYRGKVVGISHNQVLVIFEDVDEMKANEQNSEARKKQMDVLMERAVDAMLQQSGSAASEDDSWMTSAIHGLLTVDLADDEVLIEEQNRKSKVINAADVGTLIKNLSKADVSIDDTYVKQFLISFRYFLTPSLLLKKMILKYLTLGSVEEKGLTPDHKRVLDVLDLWIRFHFYDFENDIELLRSLQGFISGTLMNSVVTQKIGSTFLKNIEKQMHIADFEAAQPVASEEEQEIARKVSVLDYSPSEIADQMTLLAFDTLKFLKPIELYSQSWNKEGGAVQSPNVHALIRNFNRISVWISSSVVTCANLKKRIAMVKHFIQIAWAAYGNRDYETTFAITLALLQQQIDRLTQTWKGLDQVTSSQWEKLQRFTSFNRNYKVYRSTLKHLLAAQGSANVIPYFGLYLKDLTLLDENSNFTQKGAVNFLKMRRVADVISDLQRAQKSIFNIPRNAKLMAFLRHGLLQLDDDQIWDLSMKCEAGDASDHASGHQRVSILMNKFLHHEGEAMITTRNPVFGMKLAASRVRKVK